MKLLNYTSKYFSIFLLIIIAVWAVVFYYVMLSEIYDSMDDSLENQKLLVLKAIEKDSTILKHSSFENQYYLFEEVPEGKIISQIEHYFDTLIYMENEDEFEPVRALRSGVKVKDEYFQMMVITSMVEEDDLMASLLYSIIGLYIGLVGTILLTNNLLLKKIWNPFYHLLYKLKKFRVDRSYKPIPLETNIDEFRMLNEAVEKLILKNVNIFQLQKEFIENASHELQTPLAIALNKLELLANNEGLSTSQLEIVATTIDNLQRLVGLNQSLLLLAKIDNYQFEASAEVIINDLIKEILRDFQQWETYNSMKVTLIEDHILKIEGNPELLRIIFTNLIKNAMLHNEKGGFVNVIVTEKFVAVENSGHAKLNEDTLFTRFQKSSIKNNKSTGLGLAIAKAIADTFGYKLKYTFYEKHIFQLFFS